MDELMSERGKLCMWLSSDPDYILEQCGDILSKNEDKQIQQQTSAEDKMRMLLKIISQKGEGKRFLEILKQHQTHYSKLNQSTEGSITPTVFTDGNSVVTTREITNATFEKTFNMKIETGSHPGSGASGNVVGPVSQADYDARGGSVICADKFSNVTFKGDTDFSVTVKPACAGTVAETLPSSQGPAAKTITEHKRKIIDCLSTDRSYILQLVHAKAIVTPRQYAQLKPILQPGDTINDLIDNVIGNGEEFCSQFLEVLKDTELLNTFPQLKDITKNWR